MKKIFIKLTLLMVFIGLIIFLYLFPTMKFKPLIVEKGFRNELIEAPELLTEQFKSNLEIVFKYYEVRYRVDSNKNIYITFPLSLKKEIIWNYTTKALDNDYVKSHKELADQEPNGVRSQQLTLKDDWFRNISGVDELK